MRLHAVAEKSSRRFGTPEGTRTPDRRVRKALDTEAIDPSSGNHSIASDEGSQLEPAAGAMVGNESGSDAVEVALGDALTKAAAAAQWDVVARLAAELEARRKARSGTVDLASERAKRGQR